MRSIQCKVLCLATLLYINGVYGADPTTSTIDLEIVRDRPVLLLAPSEISVICAKVTNSTQSIHNCEIVVVLPNKWEVLPIEPQAVVLTPEQMDLFPLAIRAPPHCAVGNYHIAIEVHEKSSQKILAQEWLEIMVIPHICFCAEFEDIPVVTAADADLTLILNCSNNGNDTVPCNVEIESDNRLCAWADIDDFLLPPNAHTQCSITVLPSMCMSDVATSCFVTARIRHNETNEILFEKTILVEFIPRGGKSPDEWVQVPGEASLVVMGDNGQIVGAVQVRGCGIIDEDRETYLDYFFRVPTEYQNTIFGQYQVLYVGLSEPAWSMDLGDTIYSLSPLTERWNAARGAGLWFNPDDYFEIGGYYASNPFGRDFYRQEEFGGALSLEVGSYSVLSFNLLHKRMTDAPNAQIGSIEGSLTFGLDACLELEVAEDFERHPRQCGNRAYHIEARGKWFGEGWYYFEKTHADPGYFGYYNNMDLLSGAVDIPVGPFCRATMSGNHLRQSRTSPDLWNLWTNQDLKQMNGILSYCPTNCFQFSVTGLTFEGQDFYCYPQYDFKQQWGGTIVSYNNCGFNAVAISSWGTEHDLITCHRYSGLQRYSLFANWNSSPDVNWGALYETGNTNYYDVRPWRHTVGGSVRVRFNHRFWAEARVRRAVNVPFPHNFQHYTTQLSYLLPNDHRIDADAQYFLSDRGPTKRELLFLVSYSVSFDTPVKRREDIGSIRGAMFNSDTGLPIANAVVNVAGRRTLTDEYGSFALYGLCPGTYSVRTELMPRSLITASPDPFVVPVQGGRMTYLEIDAAEEGRISGTLSRYDVPDTLESTEMIFSNANGPLPLQITGGQPNVRVTIDRNCGEEIYSCLTSENGRYFFEKLRPGVWRISVDLQRIPDSHVLAPGVSEIELQPGEGCTVNYKIVPRRRNLQQLSQ